MGKPMILYKLFTLYRINSYGSIGTIDLGFYKCVVSFIWKVLYEGFHHSEVCIFLPIAASCDYTAPLEQGDYIKGTVCCL